MTSRKTYKSKRHKTHFCRHFLHVESIRLTMFGYRFILHMYLWLVVVQLYADMPNAELLQPTQYKIPFWIRGGSSSPRFHTRYPHTAKRYRSSQQTHSQSTPVWDESEQSRDGIAREMIDAFLTRDSRNSFIGE